LHDRRDGDINDQRLRGPSAHTLINGASAGFGLRVESECHFKDDDHDTASVSSCDVCPMGLCQSQLAQRPTTKVLRP
jgi:hypothetical protein